MLDEPWEGLDPDASRWLTSTLETKRDRGAAVVVSSHRVEDVAGFCDAYLVLLPHQATLVYAHERSRRRDLVTPGHLSDVLGWLRDAPPRRALALRRA